MSTKTARLSSPVFLNHRSALADEAATQPQVDLAPVGGGRALQAVLERRHGQRGGEQQAVGADNIHRGVYIGRMTRRPNQPREPAKTSPQPDARTDPAHLR
jgi:hypothetical protein